MKPKYSCPECPQQFSRKWNMREHCRTQHNYDPEPNLAPLPEVQRKITATSEITTSHSVERFLKMMSTSVRFQKTGVSSDVLEVFANSWSSIENAVDYLLDNFVIVNKREIHGISAYFCSECLEFEYRYIRNIGEDKTARDLHVHTSNMLSVVNKSKENELRNQAYKVLVELTDSLLPDAKKFMHLKQPLEKFRGPVIKVDSFNPNHWTGIAVQKAGLDLKDQAAIYDFVMNVQGTYAVIHVTAAPFTGFYLVTVQ